jgi:hypothetical protein
MVILVINVSGYDGCAAMFSFGKNGRSWRKWGRTFL